MTAEIKRPEEEILPAFWTPVTEKDRELLRRQRKGRRFDLNAVRAVARRCRYGCPQVVVTRPVAATGAPFPTLFWLTCPWLERRCGELEALQKIAELEKLLEKLPEETLAMHAEYIRLRQLLLKEQPEAEAALSPAMKKSLAESGVGGINFKEAPTAAKCLHLQTATLFGLGKHPAQSWLLAELGPSDCPDFLTAPCSEKEQPR